MMCYKDKEFCTARCDNLKCSRKISYSQTREAERLELLIAFNDLSEGCADRIIESDHLRDATK